MDLAYSWVSKRQLYLWNPSVLILSLYVGRGDIGWYFNLSHCFNRIMTFCLWSTKLPSGNGKKLYSVTAQHKKRWHSLSLSLSANFSEHFCKREFPQNCSKLSFDLDTSCQTDHSLVFSNTLETQILHSWKALKTFVFLVPPPPKCQSYWLVPDI